LEPLGPPKTKKPTRGQPAIQIDDIQVEALQYHDEDVDITMGKDLEKRGIKPSTQMENFWPKDQEAQSKAQPSQFHGMPRQFSVVPMCCKY